MTKQNFEAEALRAIIRKLRSNLIGLIVRADKEIFTITEMKDVPFAGTAEVRGGSTSDSPEVVGVLDAIQRKRMLDALERLSTAKSDEDQRVAANEIAKEKRLQDSFDEMVFVVATGKTPEQYTAEQVRAAQKDIEAATEMHDVPLGGKQEDLAAFEIHTLDERGLITVSHKIYADGRTEGFPPASLIINRIPSLEAAAFSRGNRWKS